MDADPDSTPVSPMARLQARLSTYRNWAEPLTGRVCSRVTVDRNAPPVVLWFMYDGPAARVEVNVQFRFKLGPEEWHLDPETDRPALAPLLALIERRVTSAMVRRDGSLRIEFSGEAVVEVPTVANVEAWSYEEEADGRPASAGDIEER